MENETNTEMLYRIRTREDGWTPEVMEMFIIQLIETGRVRTAASNVDRHVTTAYRLRARDPAFARAWDAARRMAYSRLRDEAMERVIDGSPQEVWKDGQWVGMKRVYSDRLLMNLLNHLKLENPHGAMRLRDADQVEDARSDAVAGQLERLNAPPPPPAPVRLRPAKLRIATTASMV